MSETTTRVSVCLAVCLTVGAPLAAPFFREALVASEGLEAPGGVEAPDASVLLEASVLFEEGAASGAPTLFRIGLVLSHFGLIRIFFRLRHSV